MCFRRPTCGRPRPEASHVDDGSAKVFSHGSGQPGRHAEGGVEGRTSVPTCEAPARGSRPLTEGAIAEPPGESRSATEAKVFGPGAPERISRRVAPDAGASAGDRPGSGVFGRSGREKHRMPSSRLRTRPRIGESGVGSDAGPICFARSSPPAIQPCQRATIEADQPLVFASLTTPEML